MKIKTACTNMAALSLIAITAVLVHGYHLGADDGAIYVPGIKKAADPALFPVASEFFMSHARLSMFSGLVGGSARLTGLPVDLVIFLWHVGCIFLLLLACYQLLGCCFRSIAARWAGVALIGATLSVPVAGTALVIMDPYLTARSLSTPATLFAITACVSEQWKRAFAWLLIAAAVHPQMAIYGAVFLVLYLAIRVPVVKITERASAAAAGAGPAVFAGVPFGLSLEPSTGAAREALFSRTYFFVASWTWYEWVGVFAPLLLLWWFARIGARNTTPAFARICRALVPFGLFATIVAVVLELSPHFENLTRLQPMRSLHLLYVIFFALLGGVVAEYVLKSVRWRWMALFASLAVVMFCVQRSAYASSPHLEFPGLRGGNRWISAFMWIRNHTPKTAVFALEPNYMASPGEDEHGFRAIAERSALADQVKDSGAVSLFPALAKEWKEEVQAEDKDFASEDFEGLERVYQVDWVVTSAGAPPGLTCPYGDRDVFVCQLPRAH